MLLITKVKHMTNLGNNARATFILHVPEKHCTRKQSGLSGWRLGRDWGHNFPSTGCATWLPFGHQVAILHLRALEPDVGTGLDHGPLNHAHEPAVHLPHLLSDKRTKGQWERGHPCPKAPDPMRHRLQHFIPNGLSGTTGFSLLRDHYETLCFSSVIAEMHHLKQQ